MVIGGGKVYAEAIHGWDRLYLTLVEGDFKGDTYFPRKSCCGRAGARPANRRGTPPTRKTTIRTPSTSSNACCKKDAILPNRGRRTSSNR